MTGATGFIGAHVVRALLARGERVRCLVRSSSPRSNIAGLPVDVVAGDLLDRDSLRRAMRGADTLFHCAADYRLWARDPREIYATNVDGTGNVLDAASDAGVHRIVYTSSVATIGIDPDGAASDERCIACDDDLVGHYKKSKAEAERIVQRAAADGLPAIIVNPSTPVGELDVKPTPTGQIIVDFLCGKMPAYVDTGLNVIDVRDVAEGHLLAAEHGVPGQRYILGNTNLTLKELLDVLARVSGRPAVCLQLPHWIPMTIGAACTAAAALTGRAPRVPLDAVRMSRHRMFFSASKAVSELGLPQRPIEDALARAVQWFRAKGYATAAA
ncbi:MAG TPA: hopanoid-associated sugar epimerase [Thermoanaerobaculia bacterium]|nr:hopanoid-associated sugar epimerase [Thermoanaerobaculia bacterium]